MGVKVLVRATVELSGFPRGQERVADVDVPRVRQMLDAGYVVLVNPADAVKIGPRGPIPNTGTGG